MTVSDYTHTAGPAAGAAGSSGAVFSDTLSTRSSDCWAKNQLGERRFGELFFGRQTIGRQARTVRRQQIGRLGDIVQTVGRNV